MDDVSSATAGGGDTTTTTLVVICDDDDDDGSSNREFRCNKETLRSASNYFARMFESGMKDASADRLRLPSVNADAFRLILECIENDDGRQGQHRLTTSLPRVEPPDDWRKIRRLVSAADFLDVRHPLDLFDRMMREHCAKELSLEHFVEQMELRETFCHAAEACDRFDSLVAVNLGQLVPTPRFGEMSLTQLKRILAHPNARVGPADRAIEGIVRWVEHDAEARRDALDELVDLVDLSRTTTAAASALAKTFAVHRRVISSNPEASAKLRAACEKLLHPPEPTRTRLIAIPAEEPTQSSTSEGGRSQTTTVFVYDLLTEERGENNGDRFRLCGSHKLRFPNVSCQPHVAAYGNLLYLMRERDPQRGVDVVEFNLVTGESRVCFQTDEPIGSPRIVVLNGLLYIVFAPTAPTAPTATSSAGAQTTNGVQRVNPASGQCERLPNTIETYPFPLLATFDHRVYVMSGAGQSRRAPRSSVEQFDTLSDQWTLVLRDTSHVWRGCALSSDLGKLYVVTKEPTGDLSAFTTWRNAPTSVRTFDVATGEWDETETRVVRQMLVRQRWMCSVSVQQRQQSSSTKRRRPLLLVADASGLFCSEDDDHDDGNDGLMNFVLQQGVGYAVPPTKFLITEF